MIDHGDFGHAARMLEGASAALREEISQELGQPLPKLGRRHIPGWTVAEHYTPHQDGKAVKPFAPVPCICFDISELAAEPVHDAHGVMQSISALPHYIIKGELEALGCDPGLYEWKKTISDVPFETVEQLWIVLPILQNHTQGKATPAIEQQALFLAYLLRKGYLSLKDSADNDLIQKVFGVRALMKAERNEIQSQIDKVLGPAPSTMQRGS